GPGGRRGDHEGETGLRPLGADLLRRVRRPPPQARAGQGHRRVTRSWRMSSGPVNRLSYEESCKLLQRHGYPDAGAEGAIPPVPDHRPQGDDEEPLGVCFFRTFVGQDIEQGDDDESHRNLENLTLPRTFFGKSHIQYVSFKNTDLSESTLCWNDF